MYVGFDGARHRTIKRDEFAQRQSQGRFPAAVFTMNEQTTTSRQLEFEFTREGAEVAQVYVSDTHSKTPRPAKELKGFVKV